MNIDWLIGLPAWAIIALAVLAALAVAGIDMAFWAWAGYPEDCRFENTCLTICFMCIALIAATIIRAGHRPEMVHGGRGQRHEDGRQHHEEHIPGAARPARIPLVQGFVAGGRDTLDGDALRAGGVEVDKPLGETEGDEAARGLEVGAGEGDLAPAGALGGNPLQ